MFHHPISLVYYAPAWLSKAVLLVKFSNSWQQIPKDTKYLFIHVPKTGGSSLAKALYGGYINHVSVKIHYLLDQERFARMIVFAIIRHPAERFLSSINHCLGKSSRASKDDIELGKRLLKFGDDAISIAESLCISPASIVRYCGVSVLFVPQYHWLCIGKKRGGSQLILYGLRDGRGYLNAQRIGESCVENVAEDLPSWKNLSSQALDSLRVVYAQDWKMYQTALALNPVTDVMEVVERYRS